jgi:hypothetical protein
VFIENLLGRHEDVVDLGGFRTRSAYSTGIGHVTPSGQDEGSTTPVINQRSTISQGCLDGDRAVNAKRGSLPAVHQRTTLVSSARQTDCHPCRSRSSDHRTSNDQRTTDDGMLSRTTCVFYKYRYQTNGTQQNPPPTRKHTMCGVTLLGGMSDRPLVLASRVLPLRSRSKYLGGMTGPVP